MLDLLIFAPALGLKSPSPFALKAIGLMEMSGLEYQTKPADPRKAPKQKLPVLVDGTTQIPDTTHIQAYLKDTLKADLDEGLDTEQLAIAEAFRRMNEEHLYWVLVYGRWIENGDSIRDVFFGMIPAIMRKFIFNRIVRKISVSLHGQGLGRHSPEQIYAFGAADLKAVSDYLGDKDFFFGDRPTSIDASLCGMLASILIPDLDTPLKQAAMAHKNLVDYCDRFAARYKLRA